MPHTCIFGFAHGTCHAVGISVALTLHRVLTNPVLITHKTVKAIPILFTLLTVFAFTPKFKGVTEECLHTELLKSNAEALYR
jgi:hypothetical protein